MDNKAFQRAVEIVGSLPPEGKVTPSQDEKLKFYALYKQATIGDCNVPAPGMFDFVGKAKYNAWNSEKNTSKTDAEKNYVDKLEEMLKKVDDEDTKRYLEELKELKQDK